MGRFAKVGHAKLLKTGKSSDAALGPKRRSVWCRNRSGMGSKAGSKSMASFGSPRPPSNFVKPAGAGASVVKGLVLTLAWQLVRSRLHHCSTTTPRVRPHLTICCE